MPFGPEQKSVCHAVNKITLSFLIVGHMKFSPNWCFGLFKQAYRRTNIGCLDDIVKFVESSTAVNHTQLVGTQDGEVVVPTYDWATFFDNPFKQKAFQGIKAMHHVTFNQIKPGIAVVNPFTGNGAFWHHARLN